MNKKGEKIPPKKSLIQSSPTQATNQEQESEKQEMTSIHSLVTLVKKRKDSPKKRTNFLHKFQKHQIYIQKIKYKA